MRKTKAFLSSLIAADPTGGEAAGRPFGCYFAELAEVRREQRARLHQVRAELESEERHRLTPAGRAQAAAARVQASIRRTEAALRRLRGMPSCN